MVTFLEFLAFFDEKIVLKNLNRVCRKCSNSNTTYNKKNKRFDCYKCNTSFSLYKDTIFYKSRFDIRIWFYVIYILIQEPYNLYVSKLYKANNNQISKHIFRRIKHTLFQIDYIKHIYFVRRALLQIEHVKQKKESSLLKKIIKYLFTYTR